MDVDCISFSDTGYFSKIIQDYLNEADSLKPFYNRAANLNSFSEQLQDKQFAPELRATLHRSLLGQYQKDGIDVQKFHKLKANLDLLQKNNAYTITTGHQLCLLTGPLYFIYKIVSTIKLSQNLKKLNPDSEFIPVYWMATEDHDFEEVNHFYFQGEKLSWSNTQSGAVGRMNTDGLDAVLEEFKKLLPNYGSNSNHLLELFKKAYTSGKNLAAATRYLVNELFHEYGLIILDGDDIPLKTQFKAIAKEELTSAISAQLVESQSVELQMHYPIQVNPRDINLFYLTDGDRNRIIRSGNNFQIDQTNKVFSELEILEELDRHPERFSPNVLLRPLYQELILPNLAYIGGGGELAYWFQLKSTFDHFKVQYPIMVLRNSVMYLNSQQSQLFEQLNLSMEDLFSDTGRLIKNWHIKNAEHDLLLKVEEEKLNSIYAELALKVAKQDQSLVDHVEAMKVNQLKTVRKLSEKLIRSQRRKEEASSLKIQKLKDALFPGGSLQERKDNVSTIWISKGRDYIPFLLDSFEIPSKDFLMIFDK